MRDFIPPKHNRLVIGLTQALLPLALKQEGLKLSVSANCLKHLRDLPGSTVIMLNHSDKDDPVTAFALSKECGQDFYYLSARELFDENHGMRGWFIQHCGAYSVIRGEPADSESREATIRFIAEGKHKLIMFPEGDVTGRHDKIVPLKEDGIRNIIEAQRRILLAGEQRAVYLLPATSFYEVQNDALEPMANSLLRLEQSLGDVSVEESVGKRASAVVGEFVENLESEFGVTAAAELAMPDRIRHLGKHATLEIARKSGITVKTDEPPAVILYSVRGALRKSESTTKELDRIQQLLILATTLESEPFGLDVVWRVIDRLEQLQFGKAEHKGTRVVHIDCGAPISLLELAEGSPPNALPEPAAVEELVRNGMQNTLSRLRTQL
jgi:hypothetical protein